MSNDDSLELVINLATDHRDIALRALGDVRKVAEAAANKLGLLTHYRDEYQVTPNCGPEPELTDPIRMANTRAFIDKLDLAITQQGREVANADARVGQAAKAMQGAEMRLKSLDRLRERRDQEAQRIESRRDQIRTDAFAARAARAGGASLDPCSG